MDSRAVVRNEIENILHELDFLKILIAKLASHELDAVEIRAAALSLSTIYSGMERVILEALKDRFGFRPEGLNWHVQLLERAGSSSLISEPTQVELKSFLAFRHFIRHAYSFEINPRMIEKILDRAPDLVHGFIGEIRQGYLGSVDE